MSNTPDKCPHCGADAVESSEYVSFYCGFKPAFNIRTNLCLSRAELAATRKELEECKVSSKRWQSLASGQIQTTAGELAELETLRARVRELESTTDTLDLMRDEFQRIVARMVEDGVIIKEVGQEILGICNRARSQITQRVPVIAQRDAATRRAESAEAMARHRGDLLLKAESRVRELEGLAIGNQEAGEGGLWIEVFIPTEYLGGADCEGEECPTLGQAMPRKE